MSGNQNSDPHIAELPSKKKKYTNSLTGIGSADANKEAVVDDQPKDNYSDSVCHSCVVEPGWCCFGMTLPCCALHSMRKKLLGDNFDTEYNCCQDNGCPRCAESQKKYPRCCLFLEAFMCPMMALIGSRAYYEKKYHVAQDSCEKNYMCVGTTVTLLCCPFDFLLNCFALLSGNSNVSFDKPGILQMTSATLFSCGILTCNGCLIAQVMADLKNRESRSSITASSSNL